MSNVLVIGGCGYIGSAIFQHLKDGGHYVRSVDTEIYGSTIPDNIKKNCLELTEDDLLDFETIILLSGPSWPGNSENFQYTIDNNVVAYEHVFRLLKPNQQLIYASTGALNNGRTQGWCDDYPNKCYHNYDLSKFFIEKAHTSKYIDKNIKGLRFGTVFGYAPNFRNDTIINKIYNDIIDGKEIVIRNGDSRRGFLGISDLLFVVKAMVCNSNRISPSIYNLSSFNSDFNFLGKFFEKENPGLKITYQTDGTSLYNYGMSSNRIWYLLGSQSEYQLWGFDKFIKNNFVGREYPKMIGGRN